MPAALIFIAKWGLALAGVGLVGKFLFGEAEETVERVTPNLVALAAVAGAVVVIWRAAK